MALGERWQGRTYRWTGYALANLCTRAIRSCAINVFDQKTPSRGRLGGFFPMVRFSAAGFERIKRGCAGEAQCVVSFEGRLVEARTDPERALRLVFEDAAVHGARQPRAGEEWFAKAAPKKASAGRTLRSGTPTVPKLTLKRATF
jgi:hypothetical protein